MNTINLIISSWENAEPEFNKQYNPDEELPEKFFDDTQDKEPYDY